MWRDAATVILTSRKSVNGKVAPCNTFSLFDYQVLMVKRSSKSKFMPNALVFPGGVLADTDTSIGWLEFFREQGITKDDIEELVLQNVDRPMLMKKDVNEEIARDIALRITAIREMFEETGVLLSKSICAKSSSISSAFDFCDSSFLSTWRKSVHDEPGKLLDLFRELEVVPDIWGLSEWSDWLTPTTVNAKGRRRFDTIFYSAFLDAMPSTMLDKVEVSDVQWKDPADILDQYEAKEQWLAPPQVFELCRLLNFTKQEELARFARFRQRKGLSTWLPVWIKCSDGMLEVMPGDSMYPTDPDYEGSQGVQNYLGSIEDSRMNSELMNRVEVQGSHECVVRVRGVEEHGHVTPVNIAEFYSQKEREKK